MNKPPTLNERIDKILHIELPDNGTKVLKLIDVNEAKATIHALIDEAVRDAIGEDEPLDSTWRSVNDVRATRNALRDYQRSRTTPKEEQNQ